MRANSISYFLIAVAYIDAGVYVSNLDADFHSLFSLKRHFNMHIDAVDILIPPTYLQVSTEEESGQMYLQQAIAQQIANNEARTEVSGIDIADAGNVLSVIDRFLRHNNFEDAANALHIEHMP